MSYLKAVPFTQTLEQKEKPYLVTWQRIKTHLKKKKDVFLPRCSFRFPSPFKDKHQGWVHIIWMNKWKPYKQLLNLGTKSNVYPIFYLTSFRTQISKREKEVVVSKGVLGGTVQRVERGKKIFREVKQVRFELSTHTHKLDGAEKKGGRRRVRVGRGWERPSSILMLYRGEWWAVSPKSHGQRRVSQNPLTHLRRSHWVSVSPQQDITFPLDVMRTENSGFLTHGLGAAANSETPELSLGFAGVF